MRPSLPSRRQWRRRPRSVAKDNGSAWSWVSSLRSSSNYRGRLELDLAGVVEQIGYEDHAHGGEMAAHQSPPDSTELRPSSEIGRLVDAIGSDAANFLGRAAGHGKHGEHIAERLLELRYQLGGAEDLVRIPTDL